MKYLNIYAHMSNTMIKIFEKIKSITTFFVIFLHILVIFYVSFLPFVEITQALAAAPTFIRAGAIDADATGSCEISPSMSLLSGTPLAINDIVIAVVYNNGGANSSTVSEGWTEITELAGTHSVAWYWKRLTSVDAPPSISISAGSTDCFGVMYAIRGALSSGTPYEDATIAGNASTADNNPDTALITTTNTDRFVVSFLAHNDDTAFSSGNPPSGWTGESNLTSTTGTDVGFNVISKTQATAANVFAVTFGTLAASELWGSLTLAFKPDVNNPPVLTIVSPFSAGDTVTVGDVYNITYELWDDEDNVTAAFYYDTDNTGLNGIAITSDQCDARPETFENTCNWDTTGVTPGDYYIYAIANDGSGDVSDYSTYQVTVVAGGSGAETEISQSAYRWFTNTDSVDVGGGAIMNAPTTAPTQGTPFRLRLLLHVSNVDVIQNGMVSLLQYAERSGLCDTSFSGESWSSLSSTTGAIRYYNNSSATDGATLTVNRQDPRHASSTGDGYDVVNKQRYSEGSNNFSNAVSAISAGEDGLWDFALVDYSAQPGTAYCFRAVESDGTPFADYEVVPEIVTAGFDKLRLRSQVRLRNVRLR